MMFTRFWCDCLVRLFIYSLVLYCICYVCLFFFVFILCCVSHAASLSLFNFVVFLCVLCFVMLTYFMVFYYSLYFAWCSIKVCALLLDCPFAFFTNKESIQTLRNSSEIADQTHRRDQAYNEYTRQNPPNRQTNPTYKAYRVYTALPPFSAGLAGSCRQPFFCVCVCVFALRMCSSNWNNFNKT